MEAVKELKWLVTVRPGLRMFENITLFAKCLHPAAYFLRGTGVCLVYA